MGELPKNRLVQCILESEVYFAIHPRCQSVHQSDDEIGIPVHDGVKSLACVPTHSMTSRHAAVSART
jgi:hypothetical protein